MAERSILAARLSRRYVIGLGMGAASLLLGPPVPPGTLAAQDYSAATPDELLDAIVSSPDTTFAAPALVEIFVRSGIAVFDDAITGPLVPPASPVSPLSFQRWQLDAMVTELAEGRGRPASDYDALFPATTADNAPVPTVGELLAAYAASALTSGAEVAKAYYDRLDMQSFAVSAADLPAPVLLVSLLGGELLGQFSQAAGIGAHARPSHIGNGIDPQPAIMAYTQGMGISLPGLPEVPPIPGGLTAPLAPIEGTTICGMAQSFISIVMQRVFSVLQAAEAVKDIPLIGGLLGILVQGVQLGVNLVTKAVDALLAPVMGVIKAISAGLAVASMLISTLSPWTVSLDLRPPQTRFGIDAEVVSGEIGIRAGGWDTIQFPPVVRECASLAGITLPNPTATDAPVAVSVQQAIPLITLGATDYRLDATGTATAPYVTQNETADQAKGEPVIGIAWIRAVVDRDDLRRLRDDLFNLLFSQLPDLVASVIRPLVGPVMDNLSAQLLQLVRVEGSQPLYVTYHTPPEEPTPDPGSGNAPGTAVGCFPNTFILADPFAIQRKFIPFPMEVTGTNTWEFRPDGTVLITFIDLLLTMYPDPSAMFTFLFSGTQSGPYTIDGDILTVQITENNAVMDTNMIALQGQITGPASMGTTLSGPYTCGNPVVWQPSIPEVGEVVYEFIPVQ